MLRSGSPNDQVINAAILSATGFFIGGPSNMISSAISADLGRQAALRGSQEALATVTGIVDGTGSIGAAGGQVSLKRGCGLCVDGSAGRSDRCVTPASARLRAVPGVSD